MAEIHTTEMHTGGEPLRVVTSGYPPIRGNTILERRRYAREHLDHLRRLLMFEPRGHYDMYGAIPVPPDHPDADLAVLFMHNEGYSTMCGHGVIALGRWAVDTGIVAASEPETTVNIQVPAGLVRCRVETIGGKTGTVHFESVPSFLAVADRKVEVPGHGLVTVDVAYGGAFYALAPADQYGLDVRRSPVGNLADAAAATTAAVAEAVPLHHPDGEDLAFLYGTILTDGADRYSESPTANVCVFADSQVDRSPTGSGIQARVAAQYAKGQIALGQMRKFESITGALFTGRAIREDAVEEFPGVVVEVGGRAHYTGEAHFALEPDDPLPGFLLR